MKLFNYLLAGILCASVTCLPAQHRADPQKLVNPESFSMILLGDPQGYTKYDINQPLFDLCTAWIADNIESLKIKAVLCTGDLVEQNDNNFDGVINNVKVEPAAGTLEIVPEDKKSVLEKLKEQSRQSTPQLPVPERKPIPGCCFEREIGEC